MPNTLVHLGLQGLGSQLVFKKADLKWVFLGCIIPDLPWILRRLVSAIWVNVNLYDLRVYSVVQASLLFCLLLAAACALFSTRPRLVFLILSVNSAVHLLLDSIEKKWGNGVHILAPFDWQYRSLGWLWPDSLLLAVFSVLGLLLVIVWFTKPVSEPVRLKLNPLRRVAAVLLLLTIYLCAPVVLKHGPYHADINSVATLNERDQRVGKVLFMDRERYIKEDGQDIVMTFANEPLRVAGDVRALQSSVVTLRAEFIDTDEIRIIDLYEYRYAWRDSATLLGLFLVVIYWLVAVLREWRNSPI